MNITNEFLLTVFDDRIAKEIMSILKDNLVSIHNNKIEGNKDHEFNLDDAVKMLMNLAYNYSYINKTDKYHIYSDYAYKIRKAGKLL